MEHYPYQSPKQLEALIKKSIIGQDEGVRVVATALAAHLLRIEHNQNHPDDLLHKDNLLIIGPTGSGKTESIRTVIRECDLPIPIAVIATNNLTASGYRGKNIETILSDLYQDAYRIINQDVEKYVGDTSDEDEIKEQASRAAIQLANKGIIILDEVDKIRINPNDRFEDSFFPRNLQHQLLKLIEGGTGFGDSQTLSQIDTTDILFILSGAFVGLEEITRQRLNPAPEPEPKPEQEKVIGFRAVPRKSIKPQKNSNPEPPKELSPKELIPATEDLIKYGYIPELVGRVTLRCRYNPITAETLYDILRESNVSPVKEFKKLFSDTQNQLEYTNNALMEIARKAEKLQTGVRGLRNIIGNITYPIYYELSGKRNQRVIVTQKTVIGEVPPTIQTITYKHDQTQEWSKTDKTIPHRQEFGKRHKRRAT
ncbi:MAG: AAA family ATPase [Acidaminococcaceae bacterium]|nr:AAA family ATPase [Acidaminococcaceae bacterium]